jgi:hypothetical protein
LKVRARLCFSFLLLALATCRADPPLESIDPTDAGHGGAPGRNVVSPPDGFYWDGASTDGSTPGMGTPPIGGGSGGSGGSIDRDARGADRPVDRPPPGCDLVAQNCGSGLGCYPGRSGYGVCTQAGSLGEDSGCAEHDMCFPGLLCADVLGGGSKLCARICTTTGGTPCPTGRTCQPYPGSTFGYCVP